ncbi:MAG: biotin transporter BioY [Rhodobacteraceae bacterium]|nr:biotin transporter BioY [Paracoccaceae bacterium]
MERSLTHIALFAALIAVLGVVPKIDLASGVPITAQSLGVMLCGTVLGARRGALAVGLFLVLTLAGLPLLAGGRGGLGVLAAPTVGYIIGFPVAAFVAGWVTQSARAPIGVAAALGAALGGIVVLNAMGVFGMSVMLDKTLGEAALLAAPYLVGDSIKAVLAGLVTQAIARARPDALLSRQAPEPRGR